MRVVVVGAGPVGLTLACLLAGEGMSPVVVERGGSERRGSRAIGLHPPALEVLARAGVAERLLSCGVRIERALVSVQGRPAGSLDLGSAPPPYRFVLSLPQEVTERVLEERLLELGVELRRECAVTALTAVATGVVAVTEGGGELEGDLLVGCDGRDSTVREALAVPLRERPSRDHYLMADVDDSTGLGTDAGIFLCAAGVVESFPLPAGRRRWVARIDERPRGALPDLASIVAERTGVEIGVAEGTASAFSAETRLAGRLAGPGWALAGDAAHVISPIGGQGLNLGLLGAHDLCRSLAASGPEASGYDRRQRSRARSASRRAELNMLLGRRGVPGPVRRAAVAAMLAPPRQAASARYFTMRGL